MVGLAQWKAPENSPAWQKDSLASNRKVAGIESCLIAADQYEHAAKYV